MSTIHADVEDTDHGIPFDAEAAFMQRLNGKDAETLSELEDDEEKEDKVKPKPKAKEDTSEETPDEETEEDDEGDETDDEDNEDDEPEDKAKKTRVVLEADADAVVKHKVDGKDVEIPVKELTRLFGQEAALTRKGQELAEARKGVDTSVQRYAAGLETLMARANKAYEPYSKLNFLALAKDPNVSAEDLQILQTQAKEAYDNANYLKTELDNTVKSVHQMRHQNLVQAATEGWAKLSDPSTGIEGWGEPMYKEVRGYALTSGIAKGVIDELVDPAAIKLLHKAMLYDKGQKARVTTTKVDKTPKKIIKGVTETVSKKSISKKSDAEARLRSTGSMDDAADVFLSRMKSSD